MAGEVPGSCSMLPLWIIEHVWTHKIQSIHEVAEPGAWPEMDFQPLSLEDPLRLRVASAQAYSIVKNRAVEHFERVMDFVETTYRLVPELVAPMKQMKIMFGLKTMSIMWMLRQGRGIIDTVLKIKQFFPSKLPQCQEQCSDHEKFLMRKNILDFKTFAYSLVLDKDKLRIYVKHHMEKQYGEHYAQKVEERLLDYLDQLRSVLPGDTYIDKILKKNSPVTKEEAMLLKIISSDSRTIATALEKLLHCGNFPEALNMTEEASEPSESQSGAFRGGDVSDQDVSKDRASLVEGSSDSDARRLIETHSEAAQSAVEKRSEISSECVLKVYSSPHFCSKHQQWVRSILQECPPESTAGASSSSPLLFQSSSSVSSSQDLTPSDLVPSPNDPSTPTPPQTSPKQPQSTVQTRDLAEPVEQPSSGSPGAENKSPQRLPQPQACISNSPLPAELSPVVRLIDIISISRVYLESRPQRQPQKSRQTSEPPETVVPTNTQNTIEQEQIAAEFQDASSCWTPPSPRLTRSSARLSMDRTTRPPRALEGQSKKPVAHQRTVSPATSQSPPRALCPEHDASTSTGAANERVRSDPGSERQQLRLSSQCQAALLQSKLLQPCIALTRLSSEEVRRANQGRASDRGREEEEEEEQGEEGEAEEEQVLYSSFDVNLLYSSFSSNADEDSFNCDPEYKPHIKRRRLAPDYESTSSLRWP